MNKMSQLLPYNWTRSLTFVAASCRALPRVKRLLAGIAATAITYLVLINCSTDQVPKLSQYCERQLRNKQTEDQLSTLLKCKHVNMDIGDFVAALRYCDFLNCLNQDDKLLIDVIRTKYLKHPSYLPYHLNQIPADKVQDVRNWFSPKRKSEIVGEVCSHIHYPVSPVCFLRPQHTNADIIDEKVFKRSLRNGFFIESGAHDSDIDSVSLLFEVHYNWTGLLVEPMPDYFYQGLSKNRKAYMVETCLGTGSTPHYAQLSLQEYRKMDTTGGELMSGIVPTAENTSDRVISRSESGDETLKVQCFPVFSLLQAVGNPQVNLWILDIEGAEFPVLQTVPWHLVDIEVLLVETQHAGQIFPGTRQHIIQFMQSKGYGHYEIQMYDREGSSADDDVFISRAAQMKYNVSPTMWE